MGRMRLNAFAPLLFLSLGALAQSWVYSPDEVLQVALGGEICFSLQDDLGFLGSEGWSEEEGNPLCLPAPQAGAVLRVEAPGGRVYHLKASPSYDPQAPASLRALVVFGEYVPQVAVPQGKPKAYYLAQEGVYYRPLGGGFTDVPGLKGSVRAVAGEEKGTYRVFLHLYGPPLGKLQVGSLALYRDGLEVDARSLLVEVEEKDGRHVYGAMEFRALPGLYEVRAILVAANGTEAGRVFYRFSVPKEER